MDVCVLCVRRRGVADHQYLFTVCSSNFLNVSSWVAVDFRKFMDFVMRFSAVVVSSRPDGILWMQYVISGLALTLTYCAAAISLENCIGVIGIFIFAISSSWLNMLPVCFCFRFSPLKATVYSSNHLRSFDLNSRESRSLCARIVSEPKPNVWSTWVMINPSSPCFDRPNSMHGLD